MLARAESPPQTGNTVQYRRTIGRHQTSRKSSIHPARCGSAYEFRKGEISVANPHDNAAEKTMDVLKLYHDEPRDPEPTPV